MKAGDQAAAFVLAMTVACAADPGNLDPVACTIETEFRKFCVVDPDDYMTLRCHEAEPMEEDWAFPGEDDWLCEDELRSYLKGGKFDGQEEAKLGGRFLDEAGCIRTSWVFSTNSRGDPFCSRGYVSWPVVTVGNCCDEPLYSPVRATEGVETSGRMVASLLSSDGREMFFCPDSERSDPVTAEPGHWVLEPGNSVFLADEHPAGPCLDEMQIPSDFVPSSFRGYFPRWSTSKSCSIVPPAVYAACSLGWSSERMRTAYQVLEHELDTETAESAVELLERL